MSGKIARQGLVLGAGLLLAACGQDRGDEVWQAEVLVPGSVMHGVHGMAFGPDGRLYASSVVGQTIYAFDVETGASEEVIPAPLGESDDVAFAPDGTMAWTALISGEVRARAWPTDLVPDPPVDVLARALPGINALAFDTDGDLYASVPFGTDALYKIARDGGGPELVAPNIGGLNGFEFGADGQIYGPLWIEAAIAKVSPVDGAVTILAETDGTPVGVQLDAAGRPLFVTWDTAAVGRVDPDTGQVTSLGSVDPPIDNLAIGPDGTVYLSISNVNGIQTLDPETGATDWLLKGAFALPGLMDVTEDGLLVADVFGYRTVDPKTGSVKMEPYRMDYGASTAVDRTGTQLALVNARYGIVQLIDETTGSLTINRRDLDAPMAVLLADDGSLIISEFGAGRIVRITSGDSAPEVIADSLDGPVGLAWADDAQTKVFVTDALQGTLLRVELGTGVVEELADRLFQPEGIAVLDDERVVVAEVDADRVSWVDINTGEVTAIATRLGFGIPIARGQAPVHMPSGVAIDADGVVYVSVDSTNAIVKIARQ